MHVFKKIRRRATAKLQFFFTARPLHFKFASYAYVMEVSVDQNINGMMIYQVENDQWRLVHALNL